MVSPVGTGLYAVGLRIEPRAEGCYFGHLGSNWGDILGHVRKGYGVVVMTNGDARSVLISEIEVRVAAADRWAWLDKALVR